MESNERLFKKGEVNETPSGQKVLVNEEGATYGVTDGVIAVWNSFNGNTVREVAEDVATPMNRKPDEVIAGVNELATELAKANLLSGS